jgi:hypothetical protein
MTSRDVLLRAAVRLRLALQDTRDAQLRRELRDIEVSLRGELGPSVPKRAAARVLGVSVTALDRWIDRGVLPAVSSRGVKRLGVETRPLLELATAVERLRRGGQSRGVIARAVRELGWRDRGRRLVYGSEVARLPRPNVPFDELRQQFEETTPRDRVLQLAALHRSLSTIAGARPQDDGQ